MTKPDGKHKKRRRQRDAVELSAADRRAIDEACDGSTFHVERPSWGDHVPLALLIACAAAVAWRLLQGGMP